VPEPRLTTFYSVFRDQLYKHLETVSPGDFDAFTAKLVSAGSTLEFLKYADALFEIVLVGGLLQPGGNYVDDDAPASPFSIFNAAEPPQVDEIKKYIEVLNKLIRRYVGFSILTDMLIKNMLTGTNISKSLLRSLLFLDYFSTFIVGPPLKRRSYRLLLALWSPKDSPVVLVSRV